MRFFHPHTQVQRSPASGLLIVVDSLLDEDIPGFTKACPAWACPSVATIILVISIICSTTRPSPLLLLLPAVDVTEDSEAESLVPNLRLNSEDVTASPVS